LLKEKPGEEDSEGFQRRASKAVLISNQIPNIIPKSPKNDNREKWMANERESRQQAKTREKNKRKWK